MSTPVGNESTLADRIRAAEASGDEVSDVLRTDERVLARITDGIYRQPASALRELIANAYDADATSVVIDMDPPRFDRMVIRDDGVGMSSETLGHVLHHIGGSLKRTAQGADLDVTSKSDPGLSPGGRKLIGKIGIGLFSVAQLTPHFQVITKQKGEKIRRVADIILAPEDTEKALAKGDVETKLKTGTIRVWSVPAADVDSQGTEIVLMDLRPQTKDLLRSTARWTALNPSPETVDDNWMPTATVKPVYHIGGLNLSSSDKIHIPSNLPWQSSDKPFEKFEKLVMSVHDQTSKDPRPELGKVLDNYLHLLWTLSLSLPSKYLHGHPFDLTAESGIDFHAISNEPKGQASELLISGSSSLRSVFGLIAPQDFEDTTFKVMIDGVELSRPLSFGEWKSEKKSKNASKNLMLVGKCAPDLSRMPESFRGGNLRFEAYLYWSPKIVPKDHNGVLIRVKGASGTLFDATFLGYQVSEQNRLNQISAEVFVLEGLEGALNIDRESFNYASIHFQFISRWLHGAIRQLTNRQKSISSKARVESRQRSGEKLTELLRQSSENVWNHVRGGDAEAPPEITFEDKDELIKERRSTGAPAFLRQAVIQVGTGQKAKKQEDLEPRLKAIALVLQAYGVFDDMPYSRQEKLLSEIGKIITAEATDAD